MLWLVVAAAFVAVALFSYARVRSPAVKHQGEAAQLVAVASPQPGTKENKGVPSDVDAQQRPEHQLSPAPVLQLQARLAEVFQAEKARGITIGSQQPPESAARLDAAVRELIQGYLAAGHEDWKDYVAWNDHHYVRNLIGTDDNFELMVICWRYGQGSRVHNHADSHCWLSVLQGCVHELQYKMPGEESESATPAVPPELPGVLKASAPCPMLSHIGTNELQVGQTGYINDQIALHAVRVPEHCTGHGAVTLHIYAPPIRRVKLYEPDNDRVVQRQPGFYTVALGERKRQQRLLGQQQGDAAAGAAQGEPLLYDI